MVIISFNSLLQDQVVYLSLATIIQVSMKVK